MDTCTPHHEVVASIASTSFQGEVIQKERETWETENVVTCRTGNLTPPGSKTPGTGKMTPGDTLWAHGQTNLATTGAPFPQKFGF